MKIYVIPANAGIYRSPIKAFGDDSRGFTLTEIMIVVFLIGLIAAFGLPSYQKALDKARIRDAIIQLTGLQAASKIYNAQVGGFWPGPGADINAINAGLGINLVAQDASTTFTYSAQDSGGGACDNSPTDKCVQFSATIAWPTYQVFVTELPILNTNSQGSGANPCCTSAGICPLNPC